MSTVAEAYRAKVTALLRAQGADEVHIQSVLTDLALREALANHCSAQSFASQLLHPVASP